MSVAVEMQNTGAPAARTETRAAIEHVLADRPRGLAGLDRRLAGERPMGDDHSRAERFRALQHAGGLCGAARARLHRVACGADGAEMSGSRPRNQSDGRQPHGERPQSGRPGRLTGRNMKHRIVHALQKYLLNPPIKLLFAAGLVPPGYALRKSCREQIECRVQNVLSLFAPTESDSHMCRPEPQSLQVPWRLVVE
jgi:hypothetical protein